MSSVEGRLLGEWGVLLSMVEGLLREGRQLLSLGGLVGEWGRLLGVCGGQLVLRVWGWQR